MSAPATTRTYSWLVNADQWARCAHERTALLPSGTVELTWDDEPVDGVASAGCAPPAGLAFDTTCRAYRSRPEQGRVDVLPPGSGGRRTPSDPPGRRGVLAHPTGLAVDRRGRLYVAETGADAVRVVDTLTGALVARVAVDGHPVDVAPDCGRAMALLRVGPGGRTGRLVILDGRRGARPGPELVRPCYPPDAAPMRLTSPRAAAGAGGPLVLWRAGDGRAAVARPDGTVVAEPDGATDLDLGPDGRLVVAVGPGLPIRDLQLTGKDGALEREPLLAPEFDGAAVAIAPNGRVAVTTAAGYGWTAGSAARRATAGGVVTYRLDSLAYRTRWGRAFVDACLPGGTSLALNFVTTDADTVLDPITVLPPERGARRVPDPDATPPSAPEHLLRAARQVPAHAPYRRPGGPETAWPPPDLDRRLQTYEVPVHAAPGRYLWVELVLTGTGRVSPAVGALRVERPGHALLAALPRAWSRREEDAAFLQRLLAPAEGLLHELDRCAAGRAALVNPRSTPAEALDWLASFAALTLDRRWPEPARRTLVAEAYPLFRRRGTLRCLLRLMEIYLGHRPAIMETWQLRGQAGVVLGATPLAAPAETIGGAGSRTAGLGRFGVGDGSATAHRFTVLVPGRLTAEQRAVLGDVLADHRPAHTLGEICELGDGMRLGRTLRLDLTAYVGPADAPAIPAVFGRSGVGVDALVGAAATGSRLDDARVGQVRVG
jgi:phage tail-like protein